MKPFIELNGRVTGILNKNKSLLTFYFEDKIHGPLICTARRNESILYYNLMKGQTYKLKAFLKGNTHRSPEGNLFTNNYLYIKEVHKGDGEN